MKCSLFFVFNLMAIMMKGLHNCHSHQKPVTDWQKTAMKIGNICDIYICLVNSVYRFRLCVAICLFEWFMINSMSFFKFCLIIWLWSTNFIYVKILSNDAVIELCILKNRKLNRLEILKVILKLGRDLLKRWTKISL